MSVVLFDIVLILLIKIDIWNNKNQITPLTIIGGIYIILISINNWLISNIYQFNKISLITIKELFVFFLIIFVIDSIFGFFYRHLNKVDIGRSIRFRNFHFVFFLFMIGVCAYSIQFVQLYLKYGLAIKGMNNGILGHISSFAFILGPVIMELSLNTKKRANKIIVGSMIFLVFFISFLFGGKYVIFINLTYFLLYFILKRDCKFDIIKLLKIAIPLGLVGIICFVFLYYIIPQMTGQYKSSIYFVFEHLFYYLLSPILGNDYAFLNEGLGNNLIPFTVPINIWKALCGVSQYINNIHPFVFRIGPNQFTNVAGLFGEVAYDLGINNAKIYICIIFIYINCALIIYRTKNKFYLSFCYSMATLAFCFFSNYFTVSGVVLPLILAIVFDLLSTIRIGKFHI